MMETKDISEAQKMGYTKKMTEYLAKFKYEEMPEDIIMLTKHAILDTLGVMLGGWLFFRREKDSNLAEYIKSFSDTSP